MALLGLLRGFLLLQEVVGSAHQVVRPVHHVLLYCLVLVAARLLDSLLRDLFEPSPLLQHAINYVACTGWRV